MNTTLRALVNQAERLVRTEAYQEAIALSHAVLRRYPRYARCYRILGQAHLGLGDFEEAANLFRRALGVDAEDPLAYAGLGVIYEERGLLDEAIWQMERAFELASGRDELRRELARLYAAVGSKTQVQLTRAALARLYARGGLWNKAIAELNDLLAREPYRLDLWVTLARTLWRAGRTGEAAVAAQTILDQAPNCLVARLILGTIWCQEGREDEGRLLLQGAEDLDPENVEAARLLGAQSLLPLRAPRMDPEVSVPGTIEEEGDLEMWPETPAEGPAWAAGNEGRTALRAPDEPALSGESVLAVGMAEALAAASAEPGAPSVEAAPPDAASAEPDAPSVEAAPPNAAPQPPLPPEASPPPAPSAAGEEVPISAEPEPTEVSLAVLPAPQEDVAVPELAPVEPAAAVLQSRLAENPDDWQTRLALARALTQEDRLPEAWPHYRALATPESGCLDAALADLEAIAQSHPTLRSVRELLGDAYARANRFMDAMEMYHWLLTHPEDE